jgi:hypothetical protein
LQGTILIIVHAVRENVEALHIEREIWSHLLVFYYHPTWSENVQFKSFHHHVELHALQKYSQIFSRIHIDLETLKLLLELFSIHHVFVVNHRLIICDALLIFNFPLDLAGGCSITALKGNIVAQFGLFDPDDSIEELLSLHALLNHNKGLGGLASRRLPEPYEPED